MISNEAVIKKKDTEKIEDHSSENLTVQLSQLEHLCRTA